MDATLDISVVVPLYNEEESLPELVEWIDRVARGEGLSYEVILVDDGSGDGSWRVIESLHERFAAVRGIKFARNYGKSAALYCGFAEARGEVVFTMDADLQDSPDEIPALRHMVLDEGYDLVSGWKKKRHDPAGKRWPSKFFNWTARIVSGIRLHDFNCGLKAYRRRVVKAIEVYGEMHRYIPILAKQAGFKRIGEKVVEHRARKYGHSKFGMERMVKGYLDLITVSFLSRFGRSPMYFFGSLVRSSNSRADHHNIAPVKIFCKIIATVKHCFRQHCLQWNPILFCRNDFHHSAAHCKSSRRTEVSRPTHARTSGNDQNLSKSSFVSINNFIRQKMNICFFCLP